ncbi:MAG: 4Fe-4S ferredoxin iron-sulfur binding domain protein [Dehalococcoidia bacterium]|nr:4Fe-4S ferredoxin iron-sulfur binding domain protein [Dehalococcoidia bacterium]
MTYIVTEACVGVKDESCIAVCPVDCIIATEQDVMVFINPDECIDCGACVPECPVSAIYAEDDVPEDQTEWTPVNYEYFSDGRETTLTKFTKLITVAMEKNKDSEFASKAVYDQGFAV